MWNNWISFCIIPASVGFLLDLILGDPAKITHPVVVIGRLISFFEKLFLGTEETSGEKSRRREFFCGCVTAAAVVILSVFTAAAAVWIACRAGRTAGILLSCLLCWQMYAAKSLKKESMKVWSALAEDDTEGARRAVSMIVGRDTAELDKNGIIRAAVETVAENTSDGVIAPMFYMALAGPAGAYFYKSVNTMDSMIGYRNDRYEYFGKCAARLDDALNFVPARLSGLLMAASAGLIRTFSSESKREKKIDGNDGSWESCAEISGRRALKIFLRDRKKHASPNSAQTEAACAGALGVQLAGPASYHGVRREKPFIGDSLREIEYEDIRRANTLMYLTSVLGILLTAAAALLTVLLKGA